MNNSRPSLQAAGIDRMPGDPVHSQLKLHGIAPVAPPRYGSPRDKGRSHHLTNASANSIGHSPHGIGGGEAYANHRSRSDTFVASNASIFSSPMKQAAHAGSILVPRPAKRTPDITGHRHHRLPAGKADPIAFDPFSDSPYYTWLTQVPNSSVTAQQFRRDASHLRGFREWVTTKFPKVVLAFTSLQMLHGRPPPPTQVSDVSTITTTDQEGRESPLGGSESDDDGDVDEFRTRSDYISDVRKRLLLLQREAQHQAWAILFESARLLAVAPGDVFVTQDVTPAREVFFVLCGQCQLLFQPKFLDAVVQTRNEFKSNHANRKSTSPSPSPLHPRAAHSGASSQEPARFDPVDLQSSLDALLAMRRLSLSTVTAAEATQAIAHAVQPLRVLASGDSFGLEACAFRFPHHSVSAVSHGALQRNTIGVSTPACLHLLVVPFHALEKMRALILGSCELPPESTVHAKVSVSPPPAEDSLLAPRRRLNRSVQDATAFSNQRTPTRTLQHTPLPGCGFRDDDVEFLRHTFLLQSIQLTRLQFLATQVRLLHVPKHEYLFTTGQDVLIYLVKSGQLRVFSPEQVRIHLAEDDGDGRELRDAVCGGQGVANDGVPLTTVETRHVELEILQLHDMVGFMEASLLQSTFSNYCLATSSDVWLYAIHPVALFTVLAHEPTASHHAVENLLHHHTWYKARKFTALNHHNTQTAFKLSLGAQRKSPIPCSCCGWSGHTSTSSMCMRAVSPKSAFIEHLLGKGDTRPAQHTPSLKSRAERVSQLRIAQAQRAGSVAMAASPMGDPLSPVRPGLPRVGSLVGRVGGMIPSKGSLLPGLADLAMLLRACEPKEDDEGETVSTFKSDVEKALERLDAALTEEESIPLPIISTPRPKTEQLQHRRPVISGETHRGSVFNLREEAAKVVARIGTATTSPPNPRAAVRRKATTSIDER